MSLQLLRCLMIGALAGDFLLLAWPQQQNQLNSLYYYYY